MKTGIVSSTELHRADNWTAEYHLNPLPRVRIRRNSRQALPYTVSTAEPHQTYTEIARFSAGGDAYAYAATVRDRIAETFKTDVELDLSESGLR